MVEAIGIRNDASPSQRKLAQASDDLDDRDPIKNANLAAAEPERVSQDHKALQLNGRHLDKVEYQM